MYTIRGGDQKEYGQVTVEQVRDWIVQRRANAQTLVREETSTEWKPLRACPEFAAALNPPPLASAPAAVVVDDNPMSAVVPYKNPKALTAYYLAIFSLIPCIGLPLGITAFILGLAGLRVAKTQPNAHGKVHAWVGIILGGLCVLANVGGIVAIIVANISSHH